MNRFIPVYQRRPSALHAASPGVATAFCAALALPPVLTESSPITAGAAIAGVVVAGLLAGVGRQLAAGARLALPLGLLIVAVNPLVTQKGETLLVRGGSVLGHNLDVTLEALAYGGVAALRLIALMLAASLFSAVVDPDALLGALRRVSPRSALTAALATRLVPVLAGDAGRLGDAARCRAEPAPRAAVARATLARALDRAVDVAAALEIRGYGGGVRPARARRRRSRHDLRVAVATVALAAVPFAAAAAGIGDFTAYPRLEMALGPGELGLAAAIVVLAAAPLLGARAKLGVGDA